MQKINIEEKFAKFAEIWSPKIIEELNDQYIKLAKAKNEFVWHNHAKEDELFIVFKGTLWIDFLDHTAKIGPGEMIVVPKGVEHRPYTKGEEVWVMLIEPKSTMHTGSIKHDLTDNHQVWI